MNRPTALVTLALALAFTGCDSGALVQPDVDPSFAKGGNAPVHRASGGGTVDVPAGRSTYAFHATVDGNGEVAGQVELHFSSSPLTVHGAVTCLSVNGNQAWLGAVITRSDLEEGAFAVGGEIVWTVVDNGEGKNAAPDLTSSFFGGNPASVCETQFGAALRDWTNGNVQVR